MSLEFKRLMVLLLASALAVWSVLSAAPIANNQVDLLPLDDNARTICAEELDLKDVPVGECVDAVKRTKTLRSLVIRGGTELTVPLLRALTAHSDTLQRLVSKNGAVNLSEDSAALLAELVSLRSIEFSGVVFDKITPRRAKEILDSLSSVSAVGDGDGNLVKILPLDNLRSYTCRGLFASTLQCLEDAPVLQHLCADAYEIDDERFGLIGRFSQLQTLELRSRSENFSPPVGAVAKLSQLQSLRKLTLAELDADFDRVASALSGLKELSELTLEWMALTESGLRQLSGLKNLQTLALRNCRNLTEAGMLGICKAPSIKVLDLSTCDGLSSNILPQLGQIASLRSLQPPLRFSDEPDKRTPEWADSLLSGLGSNKSLERLVLPVRSTGASFRALPDIPNLIALDISMIGTFCADDAKRIIGFNALRRLTCAERQCIPELATAIGKCDQLSELEIVWHSEECQELVEFLSKAPASKLRRLTLTIPNLNADLANMLSRFDAIEVLELMIGTGCAVDELKILGALPKLHSLRLNVAKSQDVEKIAATLTEMKALQSIDLAGYELSIRALQTISSNKRIRKLSAGFQSVPLREVVRICAANERLRMVSVN